MDDTSIGVIKVLKLIEHRAVRVVVFLYADGIFQEKHLIAHRRVVRIKFISFVSLFNHFTEIIDIPMRESGHTENHILNAS